MLKVKVGKPELSGKIHITMSEYRALLKHKDGNTYVTVYLEDGDIRDWRVKFLREVTE